MKTHRYKKTHNPTIFLFTLLLAILYVPSCAVKPASDLDSPEYHHKAGMRHIKMGKYSDAITSFERAVDLDKKFAPAYAGMAVAYANIGEKKKAKKFIGEAEDRGGKDPDVLTLCARAWIDLRHQEKKWYKPAEKLLKKALI